MSPDNSQYISAHSAASALARHRVEQGLMTPDQAVAFTDLIYHLVHTHQIPDDPKLLGLTEEEWKIATSKAHTTANIIDVTFP